MNTIPNGTIVQLLPKEQIDLSFYSESGDSFYGIIWLGLLDQYCSKLGVIEINDIGYPGFYRIRFVDSSRLWTFHRTSFKILLPKELSSTLSI